MKTVTGIFVYPIKGCRGISLQEAEITPTGLKHDRQFILVDGDGKFLSQRRISKMCLVSTALDRGTLIVSCPGSSPKLIIPICDYPDRASIAVDIWGKVGHGIHVGRFADEWFSDYLGLQCRLLQYDPQNRRKRSETATDGPGIPLSFSDGFPILLISEESLTDLNGRTENLVSMDRFRPNIVIAGGGEAFEEDRWDVISIGSTRFIGQKLCERCAVPLINQATGIRHKTEPLAALAAYRRIPSAPGKKAGPVVFGKNLSVMNPGTIHIQDNVIAT